MDKNAVDVIKDNLDVRVILEHYKVDEMIETGRFIRCACPIHKGNNKTAFSIDIETSLWRCFTNDECGGGDIFTLIEKIEGVGFVDAVKKLAKILCIDMDNMIIAQRKSSYQKELEEWMKFIQKRKKKASKTDVVEFIIEEEVLPLKKYRHFTQETLEHFGAGYVKQMKYITSSGEERTTYDRIVCPIYQDNIQVGVSLRKTKAKEIVKWLHLPSGLGVGNIIYNLDACKDYDEIVVVEGIFDVWSYYQAGVKNVVCVFGSKITEEQYRILFRTGKDIVLSFDGDDAGVKATKQATELFKNKATLYMVKFDEGLDPGSLESNDLINLYNKKEKII
ncbi:toprim domain-containing protein [Romboutsia sp.]|uniref:toprim domain-containing protein n=1 Tax=Romboutsia sp. TaxID=1965302 RepID=UPI002B822FCE|nr:toprim domain-containing protein [Romboutsia sp.]HSQ90184.1 toprim domain-containing protein [Romboutsia sp.]